MMDNDSGVGNTQPKVWSKWQRQVLRRCPRIANDLLQQEVDRMLGTAIDDVPKLLSKTQRMRIRAAANLAQRLLQQQLDRITLSTCTAQTKTNNIVSTKGYSLSKWQRRDLRRCPRIATGLLQQESDRMLGTAIDDVPKLLSKKQRMRIRAAANLAQRLLQQQLDRMTLLTCTAQTKTNTIVSTKGYSLVSTVFERVSTVCERVLSVSKQPETEPQSQVFKQQSLLPGQQADGQVAPWPTTSANVPRPQHEILQQQVVERKLLTTPHQLKDIVRRHLAEIELFMLQLEADAGVIDEDDELVLARVMFANGAPITHRTYEYLRSELVGWIGFYQHQELGTPIFHNMIYSEMDISIVCKNSFAFSCLARCMAEIEEIRKLTPFTLVRQPAISDALYCYEAVYFGINHDASLFCKQLQLHHPKLRADRWIVVGHEVCAERQETYFLLLLNELSMLTLTYHHNNNLFICMCTVKFTNCGRVPTVENDADSDQSVCI